MNNIFLIFGYGVPKDILKDENYNFYLKIVFNKIYDIVTKNNIDNPIIITCGGKTDMFKPYHRTEADEMIRFFKTFIKERPFLNPVTENWQFISENKSLSTLENLLNSLDIVQKRDIPEANFYIFFEQTRENRIKTLAKKILDKNYNFITIPIDFDISPNRYLDPKYLLKKENLDLNHSLWVLQSPENLRKHHKVFKEKIEYLRTIHNKTDMNIVKEWWDKKLKELEQYN
jgi:hypothetical protein